MKDWRLSLVYYTVVVIGTCTLLFCQDIIYYYSSHFRASLCFFRVVGLHLGSRFTLGHLTIIKAWSSGALHHFRAARDGELKTLPKMSPLVGSRKGFDLLVRSRPQSSLSLGFSGAGGAQPHMGKSKSCMVLGAELSWYLFSTQNTLHVDLRDGNDCGEWRQK